MSNAPATAASLEAVIGLKGGDAAYLKNVLAELVKAKVYVLLDHPWDGNSRRDHDIRILHVSDGADRKQAMLALFTSAQAYSETLNLQGNIFTYPVLIDATRAFLSVAKGIGIYINPNYASGSFRIGPSVAAELRVATEKSLSSATGMYTGIAGA